MSIIVSCGCGRKFRAKEEHVGKRAKCPACGQSLVIPACPVPHQDTTVRADPPVGPSSEEVSKSASASPREIPSYSGQTLPWFVVLAAVPILAAGAYLFIRAFVPNPAVHSSVAYFIGGATIALVVILVGVGLLARWGLAHQLAIVVYTLWALVALFQFKHGGVRLVGGILTIAFCVGMGVVLNTKRAKLFFGFYCPRCGSCRTRAGDFRWRKVRCRECGYKGLGPASHLGRIP